MTSGFESLWGNQITDRKGCGMRIFGQIMFFVILKLMTVFAEIVVVLKWLGALDWTWFWALVPMIIVMLLSAMMTVIVEGFKAFANKVIEEAKAIAK